MKYILSLIISGALVVSGFGQTRNVLVNTNNAVVQPTNFWSADAVNARAGLGLGSAATNPASAFQPSSSVLTNLAANDGGSLTNLAASNVAGTLSLGQGGTGSTNASDARATLGLGTAATNPASAFQSSSPILSNLAISNGAALTNISAANIVGVIPSSNIPSVTFTNLSGTLSIAQGGTGSTNAANARQNLGSTTVGDAVFVATNSEAARTSLGATSVGSSVFTAIDTSAARTSLGLGTASTNPSSVFQPSSTVLSNLSLGNGSGLTNVTASAVSSALAISNTSGLQAALDSKLATNGSAANLTSFPASILQTNSSLSAFPLGLLRTNGDGSGLTNLPVPSVASNVLSTILVAKGGTGATNASGARINLGSTAVGDAVFTATNAAAARTALSLGTASTSASTDFQPSSSALTNLAANDGGSLTNITAANITGTVGLASNVSETVALASNVTGVVSVANGGTGGTNAATARDGIGLGTTNTLTISGLVSDSLTINSGGQIILQSALSNAGAFRTNIGLPWSGLTSADAPAFRAALGLGTASTNPSTAFQASSATLSNLATADGGSLTNLKATNLIGIIPASNISTVNFTNIVGTLSINSGGTGATNAANARQNLGSTTVGDAVFVATNAASARTALGATTIGENIFTAADAPAIRTLLSLGTAATNPATAFQPASTNLTALSVNNGSGLTNLVLSNVFGLQSALDAKLPTNGNGAGLTNLTAANITGTVALTNGGTGATNAATARTNLGLGTAATNPATAFQPSSTILTNLSSSNGGGLTNIAASSLVGTVALASNITGTAALATNVTGVVALVNGGTGATNATGARTALGVSASDVFVGLTNLGTGTNQGFSSSPYILGSTNSTAPNNAVLALNAAGVRSVAGLTLAALTNTDNAAFRSAIGLNTAATNPASAFQPSSTVLSNLASSNGGSLTNIPLAGVIGALATNGSAAGLTNFPASLLATNGSAAGLTNFPASLLATNGSGAGLTNLTAANITGTVGLASNVTGTIAISNGGSGATTAGGARTNLVLGATWLTNTNVTNFRTAIGLGATNDVRFNSISVYSDGETESSIAAGVDGLVFKYGTNSSFELGGGTEVFYRVPIRFNNTTNAATTRTNLGLGATWLTNTDVTNFRTAIGVGATNDVVFNSIAVTNAAATRTNLGLGWPALTNTNASTSLLGHTNGVVIYTNTNTLTFTNSTVAFGAASFTNAALTRSNLGLSLAALTNTTGGSLLSAIGGYATSNLPVAVTNGGTGATNIYNARSNLGFIGTGTNSTKGGAADNTASGESSTVAGGEGNIASSAYATVAGGTINTASGVYSTVAGGNENTASGQWSFIGGGYQNTNSGSRASIVGGYGNTASASFATVSGGYGNTASGNSSFAAGYRAKATNIGAFVWADQTESDFNSTGGNTFNVRASGGMYLSLGTNGISFADGTKLVTVDSNGEVVSPTNFWQAAPIVALFIESQPTTNSTTNIVGARLLHIHSLDSPWVPNVTNTIVLPTNGTSFAGDVALVVHQGPTNTMTRVRQAGSTNDIATMTRYNEAIEFVYYNNDWRFNHNEAFTEPVYFAGTNAAGHAAESRTNLGLGTTNNVSFGSVSVNSVIGNTLAIDFDDGAVSGPFLFQGTNAPQFDANGAAQTRTNLGLGLPALTNTNNANFRAAIELGATNNVTFSNVVASGTLTATGNVTATTNLVVNGFVDFSTNHTNATPVTPNTPAGWLEIRVGTNVFYLPAHQ